MLWGNQAGTFLFPGGRLGQAGSGTVRWDNNWIWTTIFTTLLTLAPLALPAQSPTPLLTPTPTPSPTPSATPNFVEEETIIPTFETQKLARTYILDIPAPRGQITDRNGFALAQNKLTYNLAITFPDASRFFRCSGAQIRQGKNRQGRKTDRSSD